MLRKIITVVLILVIKIANGNSLIFNPDDVTEIVNNTLLKYSDKYSNNNCEIYYLGDEQYPKQVVFIEKKSMRLIAVRYRDIIIKNKEYNNLIKDIVNKYGAPEVNKLNNSQSFYWSADTNKKLKQAGYLEILITNYYIEDNEMNDTKAMKLTYMFKDPEKVCN